MGSPFHRTVPPSSELTPNGAHRCGLARPIRSEKAEHLARRHGEAEPVEGQHVAEPASQARQLKRSVLASHNRAFRFCDSYWAFRDPEGNVLKSPSGTRVDPGHVPWSDRDAA